MAVLVLLAAVLWQKQQIHTINLKVPENLLHKQESSYLLIFCQTLIYQSFITKRIVVGTADYLIVRERNLVALYANMCIILRATFNFQIVFYGSIISSCRQMITYSHLNLLPFLWECFVFVQPGYWKNFSLSLSEDVPILGLWGSPWKFFTGEL